MDKNIFEPLVKGIADTAERAKVLNPEDYIGEDGRWYCGKCHTPKQSEVMLFGKHPFCMCSCGAEESRREHEESILRGRIADMRDRAFFDPALAECTFANDKGFSPELMSRAKKYVENFEQFYKDGKGLLLYGKIGRGKTYAALAVVNALIDCGYSARFTDFSRIDNNLRSMWDGKQEYIDSLVRCDVLAIDDLASERDTEYMTQQVFSVIDARCKVKKPLILTTNLTGAEMMNETSRAKNRIYSRVYELCVPVEAKGDDLRFAELKASQERYRGFL